MNELVYNHQNTGTPKNFLEGYTNEFIGNRYTNLWFEWETLEWTHKEITKGRGFSEILAQE